MDLRWVDGRPAVSVMYVSATLSSKRSYGFRDADSMVVISTHRISNETLPDIEFYTFQSDILLVSFALPNSRAKFIAMEGVMRGELLRNIHNERPDIVHIKNNTIALAVGITLQIVQIENGLIRSSQEKAFKENETILGVMVRDGAVLVGLSGGAVCEFSQGTIRKLNKLDGTAVKSFIAEDEHAIALLTQHHQIRELESRNLKRLPHFIDLKPFVDPQADQLKIIKYLEDFVVGQIGTTSVYRWSWKSPLQPIELYSLPSQLVDLSLIEDEIKIICK